MAQLLTELHMDRRRIVHGPRFFIHSDLPSMVYSIALCDSPEAFAVYFYQSKVRLVSDRKYGKYVGKKDRPVST